MYRVFDSQHGYEPIGSEPRMCRIFDAQHVYKFLRNLETRMYRTCGAQHGYDVFNIGTKKGTIS